MISLHIPEAAHGQRLDKWLSAALEDFTRSQIQRLIEQGVVAIDGTVTTNAAQKLSATHRQITLTPPPPTEMELAPVPMDLDILFEDEHLIVINKPSGLTVHPAPGETGATLVHGLLAHCGDSLSGIGGVQRPGIVHRLDKDTSGAIIVAKHDAAHQHLSAQLQDRSLSRVYHAICYGTPKQAQGVVDAPIGRNPKDRKKMAVVKTGGKEARTHYTALESYLDGALSLVECRLETGRTHQIRVHLTHLGHPLVGDTSYGRARKLANTEFQAAINALQHGQLLHAREISFIHPTSGQKITLQAPYPQEFSHFLHQLTLANHSQ